MGKRAAAPKERGGGHGRRRTSSRASSSGRGRRSGGGSRGGRPSGPIFLLAAGLGVMILGSGAALAFWGDEVGTTHDRADGKQSSSPTAVAPASPPAPRATVSASPKASPSKAAKKQEKKVDEKDVPTSGAGTFSTAQAAGKAVGAGTVRRYRVQVEDGVDVSAKQAAAEIQQILAHPRGWAAHGRGSFQLVSENADFVIRIATPKTADKLCLAQGLNTHGELNCETTDGVVVNLKRWLLGSPTFAGPPSEYRHLIINHEVGHEIGIRQHMGCPGPGKLAPVMMQQIKGLNGCRSNAYPYDEDGIYIKGPLV